MTVKQRGPGSVALHEGYSPFPVDMKRFRSFVPPLIQSAIYPLESVDQYTRISEGLEPGYHYGRTVNPTVGRPGGRRECLGNSLGHARRLRSDLSFGQSR